MPPSCKIIYVNIFMFIRFIYVYDIIMLTRDLICVDIIMLHVDIDKSHVNIIIMLHVDIIHFAFRGKRYATIVVK